MFLAVTAGAIEEPLYRGYAIERLALLTRGRWSAGLIAVLAFALAHFPAWGIGPVIVALVAGSVATAFFILKGDLLALVLSHALGNSIVLVILLPVGHHVAVV